MSAPVAAAAVAAGTERRGQLGSAAAGGGIPWAMSAACLAEATVVAEVEHIVVAPGAGTSAAVPPVRVTAA